MSMIREVSIRNYKSVRQLNLRLGRITVLIGENGSGKSNILEAIALSAAAASNKLDNEFLFARGIRVTEPPLMRSAFTDEMQAQPIEITLTPENALAFHCVLQNDNTPYGRWSNHDLMSLEYSQQTLLKQLQVQPDMDVDQALNQLEILMKQRTILGLNHLSEMAFLPDFMIYTPDKRTLRTFEKEGQIQPLGIHGEGLLKLLKVLKREPARMQLLKKCLRMVGWFQDFELPGDEQDDQRLRIQDRYLPQAANQLDQRNISEGFLLLLFYFCLFISKDTPRFFAVENIENGLSPTLCSHLVRSLGELAEKSDKQVILSTHHPAVLDGLNLDDDEQRLYMVHRNTQGETTLRRIWKPERVNERLPQGLSEAFMHGKLGYVPKTF